jgi:hypothetical protein
VGCVPTRKSCQSRFGRFDEVGARDLFGLSLFIQSSFSVRFADMPGSETVALGNTKRVGGKGGERGLIEGMCADGRVHVLEVGASASFVDVLMMRGRISFGCKRVVCHKVKKLVRPQYTHLCK